MSGQARRPQGVERRGSQPSRRVGDDHIHPDYWTESDHWRFEERLHHDMTGIRKEVADQGAGFRAELKGLSRIQGALALAALVGPILVVVALRVFFPANQ